MVTRDDLWNRAVEARGAFDREKDLHARAAEALRIAAENLRAATEALDVVNAELHERIRDDADAGKYAPPNPYAPFVVGTTRSISFAPSEMRAERRDDLLDVGSDVPGGGAT